MKIYTMGFKGRNAEEFFGLINREKIQYLVDIRLNSNPSLPRYASEKNLKQQLSKQCNCRYKYYPLLAPTAGDYEAYKEKAVSWDEFVEKYRETLKRKSVDYLFLIDCIEYERILILCSDPMPDKCSRSLLAEWLKEIISGIEIKIIHL